MLDSGNYQVIKMGNLYNGILDLQRSKSFLVNISQKEEGYLLREKDIAITLTGTNGKRDFGYSVLIKNNQNKHNN